jgi:hypothetical protein
MPLEAPVTTAMLPFVLFKAAPRRDGRRWKVANAGGADANSDPQLCYEGPRRKINQ